MALNLALTTFMITFLVPRNYVELKSAVDLDGTSIQHRSTEIDPNFKILLSLD
jgi:hypothetical protein